MRITGTSGHLDAGGRLAARLTAYEFVGGVSGWTVRAGCRDVDEFWLAAAGLSLALRVGSSELVWSNVAASYADGEVTITGTGKPYTQELIDGT